MASIAWDVDASDGGQSLASPRPDPANRFWEFSPDVAIVGPRKTTLGDGLEHVFAFRTDYTAKFVLRHLTDAQQAAMLALKHWLMQGLPVDVTTNDVDDATYEGLTIKPGTEPKIEPEDDIKRRWRFECELRSDSPITLDYSA